MRRRNKSDVSSWILLIVFVFTLCFNFYINVWKQNAGQNGYPNSKYIWMAEPQMSNEEKLGIEYLENVNNFTVKNILDPPITVKLQTTSPKQLVLTPHTTSVALQQRVWPDVDHFTDDRIEAQLSYKPDSVADYEYKGIEVPVKTILLYNGYKDWGVKPGRETFLEQNCPVNACTLTDSRRHSSSADAILFRQDPRFPIFRRPPGQIWILYLLEAPYFTPDLRKFKGQFNWTATYRRDSDIVAPYEKFVKYNAQPLKYHTIPHRNYAEGKTKKVAWFVSNCHATNQRLEYAKQLSKYIQVDIYGKCGDKKCPRGKDSCSEMLNKDYKFYLAFENSNCRDYITEKFFYTGLQHDVIPIVMGAAPEDYRRAAPNYSFIHVDEYPGPKQLADYLNQLDKNDDLYNEYFKWKGTGEFINTFFWCRVCAMLHDTSREMTSYGDINQWWRGRDVCIGKQRWGQHAQRGPYISDYYRNLKHLNL